MPKSNNEKKSSSLGKRFFPSRRSKIVASAQTELVQNFGKAFEVIKHYTESIESEVAITDEEIGDVALSLSASELAYISKSGTITDRVRSAFAMPPVPRVSAPRGPIPSTKVAGVIGAATNIYAFTKTLPDMSKTVRERISAVRSAGEEAVQRVRDFGNDVIKEVTGGGGAGGTRVGIITSDFKPSPGADARYMAVKSSSLDYSSGDMVELHYPKYLEASELGFTPMIDSSTTYLSGGGGHLETPLMLMVCEWMPSWRQIAFGKADGTDVPKSDYLNWVVAEIFYALNTIELQQSVTFKLSEYWNEKNLFTYLVTVMDALQILIDVNTIRATYLDSKENNVGINGLAALLSTEEISRLDVLAIKLEDVYLPDQLSKYFWTVAQFMTLSEAPKSTVVKIIGTHAVTQDPQVRLANIDQLIDQMRQKYFIGITGLFAQCDAKGAMLDGWSRMGKVPIGFGVPQYSPEFTWLWANQAVGVTYDKISGHTWLPYCNDQEHSVYSACQIDRIDMLYYLSACIPYVDPKTDKTSLHLNSIMCPVPVQLGNQPGTKSSLLFWGLDGLSLVDHSAKPQPLTGNVHVSGISNSGLPTPVAYPGWRRLNYHNIKQRNQFMEAFVELIMGSGSPRDTSGRAVTAPGSRSGGGSGQSRPPRSRKRKRIPVTILRPDQREDSEEKEDKEK